MSSLWLQKWGTYYFFLSSSRRSSCGWLSSDCNKDCFVVQTSWLGLISSRWPGKVRRNTRDSQIPHRLSQRPNGDNKWLTNNRAHFELRSWVSRCLSSQLTCKTASFSCLWFMMNFSVASWMFCVVSIRWYTITLYLWSTRKMGRFTPRLG